MEVVMKRNLLKNIGFVVLMVGTSAISAAGYGYGSSSQICGGPGTMSPTYSSGSPVYRSGSGFVCGGQGTGNPYSTAESYAVPTAYAPQGQPQTAPAGPEVAEWEQKAPYMDLENKCSSLLQEMNQCKVTYSETKNLLKSALAAFETELDVRSVSKQARKYGLQSLFHVLHNAPQGSSSFIAATQLMLAAHFSSKLCGKKFVSPYAIDKGIHLKDQLKSDFKGMAHHLSKHVSDGPTVLEQFLNARLNKLVADDAGKSLPGAVAYKDLCSWLCVLLHEQFVLAERAEQKTGTGDNRISSMYRGLIAFFMGDAYNTIDWSSRPTLLR